MRSFHLLPLAALGTAFVVPEAQVFEHLAVEPRRQSPLNTRWHNVKTTVSSLTESAQSSLDEALSSAHDIGDDVQSWAEGKTDDAWEVLESLRKEHGRPPRHPHGPPGDEPHHPPPHHGPPGHGPPHHGGPHARSDKTVYQLISESKYTTKLAELLNDYPDLVEKLNGTAANYTVFAPTDKAFEKIPKHAHKPSKEMIEKLLSYHVSDHFYPTGRVLSTHTIPTLLKGEHLSSEPRPQRLSINIGLKGLTVNFYSRIVAIDIFGSNGVIHGVDSLLLPPPNVIEIIDLLPSEFSTLELALTKTGLLDTLNSTDHPGGTFFAPSNFAFQKLGHKVNMFLFSPHGQKYLKALLSYHIATGTTLYSDAAYVADSSDDKMMPSDLVNDFDFLNRPSPCHKSSKREARKAFDPSNMQKRSARRKFNPLSLSTRSPPRDVIDRRGHHNKPHVPKGYHHYDLPTMLHGQKLNVDVVRYGPYIGMKVNGFARVVIQDGIAQDGVIQTVSNVLIPPHGDRLGRGSLGASWSETISGAVAGTVGRAKSMLGLQDEMSVEDFKARFEGLVEA